jgi:hypothetical protein
VEAYRCPSRLCPFLSHTGLCRREMKTGHDWEYGLVTTGPYIFISEYSLCLGPTAMGY